MEQSPSNPDQRRAPDSGRVAVPEIAELLHLQRPAAGVAAAVVVLIGLVTALVVPDVLPPNALAGFGVGLVALLAAVTAAVVLDGRDPVVRGPRHLRRDGHSVLARMAGPDPIDHGAPVLTALERRLADRDHLSLALTGTGTDPSALAEALGRGAAAAGHTALVIDLRAAGAPGVADVGAGTVRLGEAAELADDRPYAWIGAGADRAAAAAAAAGVARRPPRDLQLLLVVSPEAATHTPELLQACDRTLLLVAADAHQRAMVSARLDALGRAGGTPEAVVVGGLQVASDDQHLASGVRELAGRSGPAAAGGAAAGSATPPTSGPSFAPIPPTDAPADEAATPAEPATTESSEGDRPSPFAPLPPSAASAPGPAQTPPPPPPPPSIDVAPATDSGSDVAAPTDDAGLPEIARPDDLATPASPEQEPDAPEPDALEPDAPEPDASDQDATEQDPTDPDATDPDATGPIRPVMFRTGGAEGGAEGGVEGFADSDPLVSMAALEQLLRRGEDQD